jgi:DNA-binding beta-propeller fold protein YncE
MRQTGAWFRRVGYVVIILLATICAGQSNPSPTQLPNGRLLGSVPGKPRPTNSLPSAVAASPDQRYVALLNAGYGTYDSGERQSIAIFDRRSNQLTDFPDERLSQKAKQSYFLGLAFSRDGRRLYASMSSLTDPLGKGQRSTGNGIAVYRFDEGKVTPEGFLAMPPRRAIPKGMLRREDMRDVTYPAGLSVGSAGGEERILVANNLSDEAVLLRASHGAVIHRFALSVFRRIPSALPYTTIMSSDGKTGYVSLWNASTVAQLDLVHNRVVREIALDRPSSDTQAGSHPTAMLFSKDESLLFVALANRDEVAVIDRQRGNIVSRLSTKLPGQKFGGSGPNALALSPEGTRLFVADAISDSVAVFDLADIRSKSQLEPIGFIPTEWYPTALAVAGGDLFVVSGKGQGAGPATGSRPGTSPVRRKYEYVAALLHGSLARIPLVGLDAELGSYTQEVLASNRARGNTDHVEFSVGGNPIHHVIYIIKENRTYDQLFGDLGVGNGDFSLVMYGEDITPNQHKLARQFGVLDNFYDSGDVSGNGHVWSTSATITDYVEKTWPIAYRGEERTYDYEGENLKEIPLDDDDPDVSEPSTGYLWRDFAQHGITYRHYGEYISSKWCSGESSGNSPAARLLSPEPCRRKVILKGDPLPENVGQPHGSPSPYPWAIPVLARNIPTKPELRGHFDPRFPDFELSYPDQLRVDEFLNEFNGFVKARSTGSDTMPQFILLRLPDDHTAGGKKGMPTPSASVADNDLAVGRAVEAVSHSSYWNDTAILILEDDAQDGPDHVDAHRSIALVISKYSPAPAKTADGQSPFVDHDFYTTVNVVRTIETLLGAPPMNVNDARAAVMSPMLSGEGNQPAFTADTRNRDNGLIYQINTRSWRAGEKLDFSHADSADTAVLNRFLWKDRMGDRPMPAPKHNVFR